MRIRQIVITSLSFALVLSLLPVAAASQSDSATSKSWRLECRVVGGPVTAQEIFVTNVGMRAVPGGTTVRWTAGKARGEFIFRWPLRGLASKIIGRLPPGSREITCTAG
jgi:hypothetical protein